MDGFLLLFFFFLFGLIFGSFFNVVGLRVPLNQPFTNDRSFCPNCKHTLSWYELIPILSYLIQGGRCRHCKEKISFIYPVMEMVTGLLFVFSYIIHGLSIELIVSLLLSSLLVIIFVSGIKYMLIPNKVLLFFLPSFVILRIIEPLNPWYDSITGALTGVILLTMIILISRGGMGAGDMKLFGVLGIVIGMKKVLIAFFLASMIGAVIGVILLLCKVIDRKQPVPFGPYIVVATMITYFYGDQLLNWYINYLILSR